MKIQVTVDDVVEEVDVQFGDITLQESCTIEEQLGSDGYDTFIANAVAGGGFRPLELRAVLYAKLVGGFPELTPKDFDLVMSVDDDSDELGNEEGS